MDISIKSIKKHVFEPKTEALRMARAKEIVNTPMVVTEKVDGTKLTLVRTDKNDGDYSKNWIVAYKGSIISEKEFAHLAQSDRENIKKTSVGIGQYYIVFDHLKKINTKVSQIPTNTEFSVEFAQNKDTLTRTYVQKGGMFLRSYGKVKYRIVSGTLHTVVMSAEVTEYSQVKRMADLLEVSAFPVIHNGYLSKEALGKNPWFAKKMGDVDWNNPLDILVKFSKVALEIPSALGGTSEGVVLKLSNGQFFKVVQEDQYDKEVRDAKKAMYRLDPEAAALYFQQIRAFINKVFDSTGAKNKSAEDVISDVNFYVAKNAPKLEKFYAALMDISGGKKNKVQINDDIHDTVRLLVAKRDTLGADTKTLGLIPIAGKPVHLGHWQLIEKAAQENDNVVVYTSSSDRIKPGEFPIKGDDFIQIWSDILIPALPKNVKVKFVDSPVRSVMHELQWLEQLTAQDHANVPSVKLYSDKEDVETNFKDEDLKKYPELLAAGKIAKVGVERTSTTDISGTKMREFLQAGNKESFFRNLPPISQSDKEIIWNMLVDSAGEVSRLEEQESLALLERAASMTLVELDISETMKITDQAKHLGEQIVLELIKEEASLLAESGLSVASVDPKTPKTVNGNPAQATTKLKIVDATGKDIHSSVSADVKEMVYALNERVRFWKKNNPYIESGFIFNGSSQYLMDPQKIGVLSKYKDSFGDIDVIIPKQKLDALESFLDGIDDNKPAWKPTNTNRLTKNFYYVGRTKSYAAIPDQLVTLWYYVPSKQVVQIDFEGDDMILDPAGYEKPSEWTKFSKDSPWDDLTKGIKGLAGALLLRALARGTTILPNAVVLTPGAVKRVQAGQAELTDKDVTKAAQHTMPSAYTLNTGGGGTGIRKAYELVKTMPYNGKMVDAYRFVEAKETKPEDRIIDVGRIFEILFKKKASEQERAGFRSFQGLLGLMKKYLNKNTINLVMKRFVEVLASEPLSPKESAAIKKAVKDILGMSI